MTTLPGHFRSPEVTWHLFLSRHCPSCELQPCRKSNAQYTPVFGLLQPLPGDFRSNDVASGSLPVTWCYVSSFPVTWLPRASYSPVWSQTHSRRQFPVFYSHFQVTSGQMTNLPGYFRSPEVTWLPPTASYSLLESQSRSIHQFWAFYGHFQVTSRQMMSLPGHFRSPEFTWRHFLSRDCLLLQATAL